MGFREAGLLTVLMTAASAQSIVDPAYLPDTQKAFDDAAAVPLRCEISHSPPVLNFGFRFKASYLVDVPMSQFHGGGHFLTAVIRVTPEAGTPVYLTDNGTLPEVAEADSYGEVDGSFVVGEGTYTVEARVEDDLHRVCREKWRLQAKLAGSERGLRILTPPSTVSEIAEGPVSAPEPTASHGKLTILLHAASFSPAATDLSEADIQVLQDAVFSLQQQLAPQSVRLVVFNLDQQSVLLRKDDFTSNDFGSLSTALRELKLGTVDYRALQKSGQRINVLAELAAEIRRPKAADAVIVLGPGARSQAAVPEIADQAQATPPVFYLQFRPAREFLEPLRHPGRAVGGNYAPPGLPDSVGQFLAKLKAETLAIWTPRDFADAIQHMAARIPPPSPASDPPRARPHVSSPVEVQPVIATLPATLAAGSEDPTDVLIRLRDKVYQHGDHVPNSVCVETIQRDRYEPVTGRSAKSCDTIMARRKTAGGSSLRLETTDRLRLDVKLTTDREIYSWAGANRFEQGEIDQLIPDGAIGTGPFAAMVMSVFDNRDARFVFDGDTTIESRRVLQYSFQVPPESSHYRVRVGAAWTATGYTGVLLVDPQTGDLVRLNVRTDELPADSAMCETVTTLVYQMARLNGADYLLPKSTRQRFIGRDGAESENTVEFGSCREFRGESVVSFDEKASAASAKPAVVAPLELPAGLPVSVTLMTEVRADQSAAGDRVEGRVAKPVLDEVKRTLLAEGTLLEGRLMRAEVRHAGKKEFTIALRWETAQVDGRKVQIWLKPVRRPTAVMVPQSGGGLSRRGNTIELPKPGEEAYAVYHFPGEHGGVDVGFRTEWLTGQP